MQVRPSRFVILALGLLSGLWQINVSLAQEGDGKSMRSTRIDFDDARIQGQSIQSGAVYLTNRKKNEIDTMLDQRVDYRSEILQDFKYDIHDESEQ